MNKIKYVWSEFISRDIAIGFSILLIFTLVSQILGLVPSYLIGQLLNGFQSGKKFSFVLFIIGIFLVSRVLKTLLNLVQEKYNLKKVNFNFMESFHEITLKKITGRPLSFFMKGNTSEQIKIIEKGFNSLRGLVFQTFFWFIPTAMTIILSCVFLLWLYPIFGLIAVVTFILYSISIFKYWKFGQKRLESWSKKHSKRFGGFNELIKNTVEIKIAGDTSMQGDYMNKLRGINNHGKKMWWSLYLIEIFSYNVGEICILFTIGLGGYMVVNNELMMGDLSIIYMWLARVVGNMTNVSNMMRESVSNTGSVSKLIDLLQESEDQVGGSHKVWLAKGDITFSDVSFFYKKESEHAVKDLSINIKSGQFVAFIGPSGAGKSTLFKLLLQGIKPQNGVISIDGVDLCNVDPQILLSQVAYIPQEKLLFDVSLRRNVLIGLSREDISDDKIGEVFAFLGLSHLMDRLHLPIGENGRKLSGGERQRILFARVLLKDDASLVLMDEPTSDLDSESENKVREAVRKLKEAGKTIIMIAHRLTIVQDADRLFFLQKGQLVSSGSHQELLSGCDQYQKMVKRQIIAI